MATCNASVTWFREPGHVQVNDRCVLENGHMEYDHLPAGKAAEQVETRLWNEAVAAALEAAQASFTDRLKHAGDTHTTEEFRAVITGALDDALKVRR